MTSTGLSFSRGQQEGACSTSRMNRTTENRDEGKSHWSKEGERNVTSDRMTVRRGCAEPRDCALSHEEAVSFETTAAASRQQHRVSGMHTPFAAHFLSRRCFSLARTRQERLLPERTTKSCGESPCFDVSVPTSTRIRNTNISELRQYLLVNQGAERLSHQGIQQSCGYHCCRS